MTITFKLNGSMTLDESASPQNGTATPLVPGDADDNDVVLARLQSQVSSFYARLLEQGQASSVFQRPSLRLGELQKALPTS